MYKIGLTGGICAGKTFVLSIFKELECYTLRADDIARNIIFAGNSGIRQKIIDTFGEEIYDEKAGIKKDEFTRILFEDEEKRTFINNLVHPQVKTERETLIKNLEASGVYDLFIYESALLVESGIYKDFDKVVVVYTTPEEQVKRLMERDGISIEDAESRIKAQFPLSEKLKVAHYTIDTTGSFENAKAKTLETFHLMKKDLKIL